MLEQAVDRVPGAAEGVGHAGEIQQRAQRIGRPGRRAGGWWRHAARLAAAPAPQRRRARPCSRPRWVSRPAAEDPAKSSAPRCEAAQGRWSSGDDQRSQAWVTGADAGHRVWSESGPAQGRPAGRSAVTETSDATLSNLLHESRRFDPPKELAEAANAKADAYERAKADRLAFWEEQAERLTWAKKWDTVLDWQSPFAKWFVGGQLNAAYNCVDRHVDAGRGDQVAFHWEGEPGDTRTITYADLLRDVCQAANALTELGVRQGRPGRDLHADDPGDGRRDARLRPARRDRTRWCSAASPPTRCAAASRTATPSSSSPRTAATAAAPPSALKPAVDEALKDCPGVRNVLVVRRTGQDVDWTEGRDVWWHDVGRAAVRPAHAPSRTTPSTRSTSCTPRAPRRSPRASCTPPAAT